MGNISFWYVIYFFILGWISLGLFGYFLDYIFKITAKHAVDAEGGNLSDNAKKALLNYNHPTYLIMVLLLGPIYVFTMFRILIDVSYSIVRAFFPTSISFSIFKHYNWFDYGYNRVAFHQEENGINYLNSSNLSIFVAAFKIRLQFSYYYEVPPEYKIPVKITFINEPENKNEEK